MNTRTLILLTAFVLASLSSASSASAQTRSIAAERFGLYVVTDDLNRAARFYQRLFGKPQVRVPGMIGFDVAGGFYAVVDRKTFAPAAVRGDTTRGYIKVFNIQGAYKLAVAVASNSVENNIAKEGRFSFFRVRDPDGNLIEFYAVKSH